MVKHFCDSCHKEITQEPYYYYIQRYRDLNRKDLGLAEVPAWAQPDRLVYCYECFVVIERFMTNNVKERNEA